MYIFVEIRYMDHGLNIEINETVEILRPVVLILSHLGSRPELLRIKTGKSISINTQKHTFLVIPEDPANTFQDHLNPKKFPRIWSRELAAKAS